MQLTGASQFHTRSSPILTESSQQRYNTLTREFLGSLWQLDLLSATYHGIRSQISQIGCRFSPVERLTLSQSRQELSRGPFLSFRSDLAFTMPLPPRCWECLKPYGHDKCSPYNPKHSVWSCKSFARLPPTYEIFTNGSIGLPNGNDS